MFKIQSKVGDTPFYKADKLAKYLNIESIIFKDETKNPSGSFKDRAISHQLEYWESLGKTSFTISSSGNAAISAAFFISSIPTLKLDIFISEAIEPYKLERINKYIKDNILIHKSKTARKDAILFSKQTGAINLTGSKDPEARKGYKSLGKEISSYFQNKALDAVFIPVSSGMGLLGMMDGYSNRYPTFACQTTKVYEIAKHFENEIESSPSSLASAIQARIIPDKVEIIRQLKESGGYALAISDIELKEALEALKSTENVTFSYDSLLSLAGLIKSIKKGRSIKSALCILTGE